MADFSTGQGQELAARAREAADRSDWHVAFEGYSAADPLSPLTADDLEVWATAAYLLGHVDAAVDAEARAHRLHRSRDDVPQAVRSGFRVAFMFLNRGDVARAGGWVARCARLIGDPPADGVERAYLLIFEAFRLAAVDQRWADAHAVATRAVDLGRVGAHDDLVALGLNIAGRSLIAMGRSAEGLTILDEAMATVIGGDLSPLVAGTVYCSLIEACEEIAEWRRAREWTDTLTRWCDRQAGMVTFTGQCLTHRAHILRLQGDLPAAAEAAHLAVQRFTAAADEHMAGGAHYESGEVLRMTGDLAGAEQAYRQAAAQGRDPQPGLALLRLVQGRTDAAIAAMHRLAAEWVAPPDRIRLLPAYVRVMLAVGDVPAARGGATELAELAATYGSLALQAEAEEAHGAVLLDDDDAPPALLHLRRAVESWRRLDAPYDVARTRTLIARACRALGDAETAAFEQDAASRTFAGLGVPASAVSLPVPGPRAHHGLTPRELEVLRLLATGRTNHSIAEELHVAVRTVDRHVANILSRLGVRTRTAATAFAYEHGLLRNPGDG